MLLCMFDLNNLLFSHSINICCIFLCYFRYEWIDMKILGTLGILYIAFHLSDLTTKFIYNSLSRQLIDNTNDKAVVITGMQYPAQTFSISKIFVLT